MANALQQLIPQKQMQFEPIPQDDDDDLSNAIKNDPVDHDDNWDLADTFIDDKKAQELDEFWANTLREVGAEAPEESR